METQQRTVITSAVILALILAGVLWYALSRPGANDLAQTSPAPSPLFATPGATTVPDAMEKPSEAAPPVNRPAPTPLPSVASVTTTANSGPAELAIALSVVAAIGGGMALGATLRRAA